MTAYTNIINSFENLTIANAGKDAKQLKLSCIVKWYSYLVQQFGSFSNSSISTYQVTQQFFSKEFMQEMKTCTKQLEKEQRSFIQIS